MHMHQHYRHPSDSHAHYISNTQQQQQHAANKNFSPPSATIAATSTTLTSLSTSTVRRQSVPVKDMVESIPSSNTIDSAMYERDKQIYKCSTMKHGGKFDPKFKPAILNCPLPEIPKQEDEISRSVENSHSNNNNYNNNNVPGNTRTYQRNLKMSGLKPIQPPKINSSTPTVENKPPIHVNNQNKNTNQPPPHPQHQQQYQPQPQIKNQTENTGAQDDGDKIDTQAPKIINNPNNPPQSAINSNDESNYAVTEL